jgi:ribosomal protein L44E
MGYVFFRKKGDKPSEKPQPKESPKPKSKSIQFHCDNCGRDRHIEEFRFRTSEERLAREMANKGRYLKVHLGP